MIKDRAKTVYEVDGIDIANKVGNLIVVNTVLLGALSALPENPVKRESLEKAIAGRLKQKYVDMNLKAFQLGVDQVNVR
jgi:indolepyruvate ferredoxin oxidoreductase beta subunit